MKKTILAQKIEAAGKVLAGHPVKVVASADETRAEILIFDVIGYDWWTGGGVTANAIAAALAELRGADLLVRINSMGGDVVDGTAIVNSFKLHDGDVLMRIEGWACSMATSIACAGDRVEAFSNTMYMVHRSSTIAWGNVKVLRDTADLLEKIDGQMIDAYCAKTGQSEEAIIALVDGAVDGTWLTAAEAKEHGFIDEVIDEPIKATALLDKAGAKALAKDEGAQLLPTALIPSGPFAASLRTIMAKGLPPTISATLGTNPAMGVVRMDGGFVAISQDGVTTSIEQTIEENTDANTADSGAGDEQITIAGDGQPPADVTGKTDGTELEPADPPKEPVDPVAAERARVKAIKAAAVAMGMPAMADHLIDEGISVEAAQKALLAFKSNDPHVDSHHDSDLTDPKVKEQNTWAAAYDKVGFKSH